MILDYMYRLYQLYAPCPRQKDMAFKRSAVRSRNFVNGSSLFTSYGADPEPGVPGKNDVVIPAARRIAYRSGVIF